MNAPRPGLAYVVNTLNPGGTERLVCDMSQAFAAEFDLRVVCLDEPGAWADDLRARGIPVHCAWRQPGLDVDLGTRLASYFRAWRTQIIHAHQCTPWFYAALSRLKYPEPRLLLEEHGRFFPEVKSPARALVNRVLIRKLTHRFVAVSQDIRERLERYEGLDARQIEVIYNGVAAEAQLSSAARAQLRRDLGFEPADFIVGTVGRFDPIKNLPMLVGSLGRAASQVASVRGLLVGDGPVFPAIRAKLEADGLSDRVRLTGFRNDARTVIQCLDLFVLSSFSEGTSMALLEAMAAGVPVAVTAVGGNPEIVTHERTGWVVPSDSVEALTAVIVQAATDEGRRRAYAQAGRARFEEQFTFGAMIESYRRRYRELLAAGAVRVPGGAIHEA